MPNYSGKPPSHLGKKVSLEEMWGQSLLRGLSSVLCSRDRLRLEGNRGSS